MSKDGPGPIERYFQILEAVAASNDGLTLTQITTITDLPKPTAHRLTRALVEAGALSVDDSWYKTFRIGTRMWRMLYLGQNTDSVRTCAQLVVDTLADELHETCYIVRLGRQHIRSIARSAPDQGHRLHVLPGEILPSHAAASAKAILAFQSDEFVGQILQEPLEPLTSRTKTSLASVKAEFESVRSSDHAVCDREIDENIMAYAAPVHLDTVGVIYSVGLTGPHSRLSQMPAKHWTQPLQLAAARFAKMLQNLPTKDAVEA